MGSENSLWVLVAPEGDVGRDQSKPDLWLMLCPPESGHEQGSECKLFCVGIILGEQERETGREERQHRVPEGAVHCCGQPGSVPGLQVGIVRNRDRNLPKPAEHTSEFRQLRTRRVGVFMYQLSSITG